MSNLAQFGALTISVQGDDGLWSYHAVFPPNASSPFGHLSVALVSGPNTITPLATATYALIIPPTSSVITKTLKGVTGDTGVPLAPNVPLLLPIPVGSGSFTITAGGSETVDVYWL